MQISGDRKEICGVQTLVGGRNGELLLCNVASFRGDENILELSSGDECLTLSTYQKP